MKKSAKMLAQPVIRARLRGTKPHSKLKIVPAFFGHRFGGKFLFTYNPPTEEAGG
jgi:hypothetical protein